MQLQSAMSLPMRRVPVSREGLYSVLAFLQAASGRAQPARPALRADAGPAGGRSCWSRGSSGSSCTATPYGGPRDETIRTWGRDRLRVLARLLPLVDERGGLPARHRPAELLVGADGRDAADARPVGLDGERLDRRHGPRPDRAAGRAERARSWATSPRRSRSRRR